MKDRLVQLFIKVSENELLERAFHTFWQTGLVVWAMSDFSLDLAVLGGAFGAGFSAAKTVFKDYINRFKRK